MCTLSKKEIRCWGCLCLISRGLPVSSKFDWLVWFVFASLLVCLVFVSTTSWRLKSSLGQSKNWIVILGPGEAWIVWLVFEDWRAWLLFEDWIVWLVFEDWRGPSRGQNCLWLGWAPVKRCDCPDRSLQFTKFAGNQYTSRQPICNLWNSFLEDFYLWLFTFQLKGRDYPGEFCQFVKMAGLFASFTALSKYMCLCQFIFLFGL